MPLVTHGSAHVLEAQCLDILARLPKKRSTSHNLSKRSAEPQLGLQDQTKEAVPSGTELGFKDQTEEALPSGAAVGLGVVDQTDLHGATL